MVEDATDRDFREMIKQVLDEEHLPDITLVQLSESSHQVFQATYHW